MIPPLYPPLRLLLPLLAGSALSLVSPAPARACGGMFCDGGPQTMPVDQKGENILYAVDGAEGTVEAHIQIQYEGAASRFAWVLPVQSLPTFEVGSQLLFQNLLQGTVPTYGFSNQFTCFDGGPSGAGGEAGAASGGAAGSGGAGGGNGPTVVFQKTVGAFDVTVLQGGTAKEVIDWLNTNGYQQNPAAEPILQQYLEGNYLFAAIKLTGGAGVDEIHPLVVKYHGTQPCIPLKLTAIAAVENMGVRAFLLGDKRWVPGAGYKHIALNPARLDWPAQGANYTDVVTRGMDSAVANGRAFVTEYAGPSNVVSTFGVYNPGWSADSFVTAKPEEVVDLLVNQQLMSCSSGGGFGGFGGSGGSGQCVYNHPQLKPLLDEFLPVPKGMTDHEFYGCLPCNKDKIDAAKWDAVQFSSLFGERIVDPGKHASDLLKKWPYLTRLFTTISPSEMTEDPEFHPRDGLPDVSRFNTATRRQECKHTVMALPDGRQIALPTTGGWVPWADEMPWAERIEELPPTGDPIVLVNNTQKIDDLIGAWNKSQGWPPPNTGGSSGQGGSGGSGGFSGSAAGGAGGVGNASGAGGSGTTAGAGGDPTAGQGGSTGQGAQSGKGGGSPAGAGGSAGKPAAGGGGASTDAPLPPPEPEGGCQLGHARSGSPGPLALLGLGALFASRRRKKG